MAKKGQKSLRGEGELYDQVKQRYMFSLTPIGAEGLDAIAQSLGISRSELAERIGRGTIKICIPKINSLEKSSDSFLGDGVWAATDTVGESVTQTLTIMLQASWRNYFSRYKRVCNIFVYFFVLHLPTVFNTCDDPIIPEVLIEALFENFETNSQALNLF